MKRLFRSIAAFLRELAADDRLVTRIALAFSVVQLVACLWDLPGAHGWENDGIAPRGVFGGIAINLSPGSAHRYPLLHFVISVVAALPALITIPLVALIKGESLAAAATSVPVMTGVSVCVKLVSIAMGGLTLLLLARYARKTWDVRAARWTALFYVVNLSLAYYGRVSNLDGPYLFWAMLALDRWAVLRGPLVSAAPDYRLLGAFCALAIATKDQAYAVVLPLLVAPALQAPSRERVLRLAHLGGSFAGTYALASGALFNPTGFVARVRLLSGPNSQDWKVYADSALGLRQNVLDLAANLPEWWWPLPVLSLCVVGLGVALASAGRSRDFALVMPLSMAMSSLFLFTLLVKRTEHRFVLPCALFATYYVGIGASALLGLTRRALTQRALEACLSVGLVASALPCAALFVTQWTDGRRAVSDFLARQPRGTRVETYGLPVYQPHFDTSERSPYRVTRLQPPDRDRWGALRGVPSVDGYYRDVRARAPDLLIVAESFAERYLQHSLLPGQRQSVLRAKAQHEEDAVRFFRAAVRDQLPGYHVVSIARAKLPRFLTALGFQPVRVHGSTGARTWVLARDGFQPVHETARSTRGAAYNRITDSQGKRASSTRVALSSSQALPTNSIVEGLSRR